jgi:hypothetical protein
MRLPPSSDQPHFDVSCCRPCHILQVLLLGVLHVLLPDAMPLRLLLPG